MRELLAGLPGGSHAVDFFCRALGALHEDAIAAEGGSGARDDAGPQARCNGRSARKNEYK